MMQVCCSVFLITSWLAAGNILLAQNPGGLTYAPVSLGHLQNTVRRVACDAGVPPDFALAIIEHESKFNNALRGRHGEIGASQILPRTAMALGFDTERLAKEFAYNAQAGVSILRTLLRRSEGDEHKASCVYRAGPGWTKLPLEAQSAVRAYAEAIQRLKRNYSGLNCD